MLITPTGILHVRGIKAKTAIQSIINIFLKNNYHLVTYIAVSKFMYLYFKYKQTYLKQWGTITFCLIFK